MEDVVWSVESGDRWIVDVEGEDFFASIEAVVGATRSRLGSQCLESLLELSFCR